MRRAAFLLPLALIGVYAISEAARVSNPSGGGGTGSGVADVVCTNQFLRQIVSNVGGCASIADADLPATAVRTSRTISTTSPLSGGGDLSADRTLTCPTCALTGTTISTSSPLSGGGDLSANRTISCPGCITQAYATVQDETSALTQRSTLNFTGAGVSCADNSGASRTDCTISGAGGSDPWTYISASGATNAASTTGVAITGLSFSISASTNYEVECTLVGQSASATVGINWQWNSSVALSVIATSVTGPVTASGAASSSQTADAALVSLLTGIPVINTDHVFTASGYFTVGGSGGTMQLEVRNETGTTNVISQATSKCRYRSFT